MGGGHGRWRGSELTVRELLISTPAVWIFHPQIAIKVVYLIT